MYPYILCFCGRALGDVYDLFKQLRHEKYEQVYADVPPINSPEMLSLIDNTQVDLSDVFDALCLDLPCCRMHMAQQVEFCIFAV